MENQLKNLMKPLVFFILLMGPLAALAQQHHLGIRAGEPFAITYKTFLDDRFSAEAMVGRGGPNSTQYYRRAFENSRPVSSAIYTGQSTSDALSLHARLAYNEDISSEFNITEGQLFGYAGVGAMLRSVRVNYVYHTPSPTTEGQFRNDHRTNIDFGPEAFIGSEYYFEDFPVSVFAEVGMFLEVVDRPGHIKLLGGIGARYLF
jgi:hypothetical protein